MKHKPLLILTLRVLLATLVLALAGCANGVIDDPDVSNSLLNIEKVEPSFVQADVVKVVLPFTAQTVDITVNSILRGSDPGTYTDVTIDTVDIIYEPPLSTGTSSLSFSTTLTVPADGSLTILDAVVLTTTDLLAGITPGTGTIATVIVRGRDLLGKPAVASATLTMEFQDFLDNNDEDGDGIDDSLDPAPLDACIPNPTSILCP